MADVPRQKMGVGMKAKSHRRCGKFLALLGTQARFKSEIHTWRAMNLDGFAILDEPSMVRSASFYWQLVAEVLLYEFSRRSQPEDFKANSGAGRKVFRNHNPLQLMGIMVMKLMMLLLLLMIITILTLLLLSILIYNRIIYK